MYQRDYLLRMLEMLGDFIASILSKIRKGDFEKASQALENAYFDYLKQDAALLQSIPKEELTTSLLEKHNYTNGHLEILSELFFAQAELQYAQGKFEASISFYQKSLLLYDFVMKEMKIYSEEKLSRLSTIQIKIKELNQKGV